MKKKEIELCGFVFDKDDIRRFNWYYETYLSYGFKQVIIDAGFDVPFEYIKDYDSFCQRQSDFVDKFFIFERYRFFLRESFRLKKGD